MLDVCFHRGEARPSVGLHSLDDLEWRDDRRANPTVKVSSIPGHDLIRPWLHRLKNRHDLRIAKRGAPLHHLEHNASREPRKRDMGLMRGNNADPVARRKVGIEFP